MNNTLEIKNLTKNYGDFQLDNISFNLEKGYIMGLIGPNGAGKTTIIKSIMNLIMKDSGQINVFGMDHQKHEIEIKKRIGFVYDTPNYYQHLTLKRLKNVIAPFYKGWNETTFLKLVTRFELPLNKVLKKFSKGMAMKASIAIALSHDADFIIMDEPTSGLDPIVRREMLDLLRELIEDENKSVLFSSHVTTDIEQVADYITYVMSGRIIFSETKDEIFEKHSLIKGDNDLLDHETKKSLVAVKSGEFGFEALSENINTTREVFGNEVIYDKPTLEDIMYYNNIKIKNTLK